MNVHQIYTDSPLRNYNYIVELGNGEVAVVDPIYPKLINEWLVENNRVLAVVLLSHGHHDHVAGVDELVQQHGAQIWGHKDSYKKIDRILEDGEKISTALGEMEVIETPGHTMDHLCFLFYESGKQVEIITMDTVFNAGIGNCKNGGNLDVFVETILDLNEKVEDQVILWPGHDYIENNLRFTLSIEPENEDAKELLEQVHKEGSVKFRTNFATERKVNLFLMTKDVEEIKKLRNKRDKW
ncbi:putative hydroxyacylglutathione hydrolase [Halobacteriovorax sp. BALOs_7]|uniref:hydroxyacylglutathione hydrolase C-terminal domain-containing protein n=1 Tax=unclassified Halobacteriovorax TaxID=2639665 RepID=UPI000EA3E33D|nr:hydroxyacylglutathione hydrolase C-terminal domain-containing protein [Halobacteriovorax sp. BALOs_7]AYF45303.1 putative hydroxyacylglutathione hydrolase [Halobacteriovorax sp. BALOs_7]